MKKTLRALFVAVLTMVWGSVFAQEVSSVKWEASSGDALTTIYVGNDIKLTWAEASGDQAPRYSDGYARLLKNNTLTVEGVSTEVKISSIVISFKSSDDPGLSVNVGSVSNDYVNVVTTWTGDANSVKFTAKSARNIKSIEVFYTGAAPVVVKAPKLNISSTTIGDTYDMDTAPVFVVYYDNAEGTEVAENAKLTIYVDGTANKVEELGTLAVGAKDLWKNMKYDLTNLTAGEHQVYVSLTADDAEEAKTEAKTVTFTQKAPEATFTVSAAETVTVAWGAENYQVVATVKNTSEVAAEGVQVMLQQNLENVVDPQTISLAAGEEKKVTFTVPGPFTAGEATLWVMVKAYDKTMAQQQVTVTFEEEPVVEVKDIAITAVQGSIDLTLETNYLTVFVENKGNVDVVDAPVAVKAGATVIGTATVSAKAGETGFCSVVINTTDMTAGDLEVTATVELEGDANADDNTLTKTVTVAGAPEPEPTFSVVADDVEVEFGATSFDIVAAVSNTSEVAAENVEVKLMQGTEVVDTKTVEALAAGATTNVTFTLTDILEAGKTAQYYVQVANQAQDEVTVTFKEEPIVPVIDMELTAVMGLTEIDLSAESNEVQVWYKNNSNVVVDKATITVVFNNKVIATEDVENINVEANGYVTVALPTEGLTAGTVVTLAATIAADGDTNADNNIITKSYNVINSAVAELTLELTAENVEAYLSAETVSIVVNVKNTSTVDAKDVKVVLYNGLTEIGEPQYIAFLAAGEDKDVTFVINNFTTVGSHDLSVMTGDGKFGTIATVVVSADPVEPVYDLAITTVQGVIYLDVESNFVTVFVENKGNVDVVDATVTLTAGDKVLGTGVVSAHAGEEFNTGFVSIPVSTEGLAEGTLEVTATVAVEDDVNVDDNTKTVTLKVTTTTGIESLKAQFGEKVQVYTLQGVKVNSVQKGKMYIINGKKVLVK